MINLNLLRLLQLSDPGLPIGGYAHSNGLETYVQKGIVKDAITAKEFVTAMLTKSLHYTDAAFVSLAYAAAADNDLQRIIALDHECTAVKLPRETRQASQKLGMRLMKIFEPICKSEIGRNYKEKIQMQRVSGHYPIAFGIYAFSLEISKMEALTGFYYNAAAGIVTNSVKLVPLSQQEGQELLFSLHPLMTELAQHSTDPNPELIGLCCPAFDIRGMQHEQLYSRLYMS